jgi:hypothetical protein
MWKHIKWTHKHDFVSLCQFERVTSETKQQISKITHSVYTDLYLYARLI